MVSKHSGCVDHTGTATNKFTHFRILVISGSWAYSIYHYCHKINCQIWFPITIFTSSPPSRGCGISRPPSRRRSRKALMAQRWNHSLHFFAAGDTAKNLSHLLVYVCMYYVCLLYIYILYIYIRLNGYFSLTWNEKKSDFGVTPLDYHHFKVSWWDRDDSSSYLGRFSWCHGCPFLVCFRSLGAKQNQKPGDVFWCRVAPDCLEDNLFEQMEIGPPNQDPHNHGFLMINDKFMVVNGSKNSGGSSAF